MTDIGEFIRKRLDEAERQVMAGDEIVPKYAASLIAVDAAKMALGEGSRGTPSDSLTATYCSLLVRLIELHRNGVMSPTDSGTANLKLKDFSEVAIDIIREGQRALSNE
jgi:hypothetical protein